MLAFIAFIAFMAAMVAGGRGRKRERAELLIKPEDHWSPQGRREESCE